MILESHSNLSPALSEDDQPKSTMQHGVVDRREGRALVDSYIEALGDEGNSYLYAWWILGMQCPESFFPPIFCFGGFAGGMNYSKMGIGLQRLEDGLKTEVETKGRAKDSPFRP